MRPFHLPEFYKPWNGHLKLTGYRAGSSTGVGPVQLSKTKRTQAERLQQTGKLIQSKLRQYIDVGQALSEARDCGGAPWLAIENTLPWPEFVASLEETRHLARKNNFDPLHIITEKYSTLRKYAPCMLPALQLVATPAAQPLADALVVIKDMYRKQSRKVPTKAPIEFVPDRQY